MYSLSNLKVSIFLSNILFAIEAFLLGAAEKLTFENKLIVTASMLPFTSIVEFDF